MPAPGKDVKSSVMGQTRLLEQLEKVVPGFSGYKEKELRRESDKLLREFLVNELKVVNEAVEAVYADLVDSKVTAAYDAMNASTALMDKVIAKVEIGDYGYSGFFDAVKIREEALDAVYEFDKALFDDVDVLAKKVEKLANAVEKGDDAGVPKIAKELKNAIMDFDKKLDKRKAVLLQLE